MMEDSFDPEAEQEAERMCLEAVMMDEYEELSAEQLSAHRTRRRLSLTILPLVSLRNAPTASHKLSEAVLQEMGTRLAEVSSEHAGSVHLMALVEAAREFLIARNEPEPQPVEATAPLEATAPFASLVALAPSAPADPLGRLVALAPVALVSRLTDVVVHMSMPHAMRDFLG